MRSRYSALLPPQFVRNADPVTLLYACLPILITLRPRLPVALLAILLILSLARNGWGRVSFKQLDRPLVLLSLTFTLLASISILWSTDPKISGMEAAKLCGMLALALLTICSIQQIQFEPLRRAVTVGSVIGVLSIVLAYAYHDLLPNWLHSDGPPDTLNRSVVMIVLLCNLILWSSLSNDSTPFRWSSVIIVYFFCLYLVMYSRSESAKLAMIVTAISYLLFFARPLLLRYLPLFILLMLCSMPIVVWYIGEGLREYGVWSRLPLTAQQRWNIWLTTLELWQQAPWLGRGFGVVSNPTPWFAHPHSLPFELLLTLGVVGFTIGSFTLAYGVHCLLKVANGPHVGAIVVGVFSVWMVSHGAWQGWWLAFLVLLTLPMLKRSPKIGEKKGR